MSKVPMRLMLLTLLVCVSLCIQGCERKLTVNESDKTVFLRARDLVIYGYGFQAIEKFESFTKARVIDGSYDIEYEFKTPDAEQNDPLFLYVLVSVGKKKSDAQIFINRSNRRGGGAEISISLSDNLPLT